MTLRMLLGRIPAGSVIKAVAVGRIPTGTVIAEVVLVDTEEMPDMEDHG